MDWMASLVPRVLLALREQPARPVFRVQRGIREHKGLLAQPDRRVLAAPPEPLVAKAIRGRLVPMAPPELPARKAQLAPLGFKVRRVPPDHKEVLVPQGLLASMASMAALVLRVQQGLRALLVRLVPRERLAQPARREVLALPGHKARLGLLVLPVLLVRQDLRVPMVSMVALVSQELPDRRE